MVSAAGAGGGNPMRLVWKRCAQGNGLLHPGGGVDLKGKCIPPRRQLAGIPSPGKDSLVLVAKPIQEEIGRAQRGCPIRLVNTHLESILIQIDAVGGQNLKADLVAGEKSIIRMKEHHVPVGRWQVAGCRRGKSNPAG